MGKFLGYLLKAARLEVADTPSGPVDARLSGEILGKLIVNRDAFRFDPTWASPSPSSLLLIINSSVSHLQPPPRFTETPPSPVRTSSSAMPLAAFQPALPVLRSSHSLSPTSHCPTSRRGASMSISDNPSPLRAHLTAHAEADIALLHSLASSAASRAANLAKDASLLAATGAAVALVSLSGAVSSLAEVPTTLPPGLFFDEASLVPKSSASMFSKAASNISKSAAINLRFAMVRSLPYAETPDEYASELAGEWGLGDSDVLFVASPKLARAGVYVGSNAAGRLTPEIAESVANETYAVQAGVERYGAAVLDVSNRLIPVLTGEKDPGPPDLAAREVVQNYKRKSETSKERSKYVTVVVVVLVIAVVAPLLQTYWYVRDD